MNTAQTTMSTTNPDSLFATINGEDYQARHAREAREEFAKIKEQALKLKAEAHAAIQKAGVAQDRVKAYEAHVEETNKKNKEYGTNYHPHPYSSFGWAECALCHNEIRDDPFGHNPEPLANGVCCSECNKEVFLVRRVQNFFYPNEDEDEYEE